MSDNPSFDRRGKPRVKICLPILMSGYSTTGDKFEEKGCLENISASGMYIWTDHMLQTGDEVYITVQLSHSEAEGELKRNYLATLGKVLRVDYSPKNLYGAAITFNNYRII